MPTTIADFEALSEIAELLGSSPGVAAGILQSEAWNIPPREAVSLLDKARRRQQLHERLSTRLKGEAFESEHAGDVEYIEKQRSGLLGFLAFLDSRYRSIKRRWVQYRQDGYAPALLDQAADLKQVDQLSALVRELDSVETIGRGLFGDLWQGAGSDLARLDAYVAYVVRYRRTAIARGLAEEAARVAQQERADVSAIKGLVVAGEALGARLAELRSATAWPDAYLESSGLPEIGSRARDLAGSLNRAPAWAAFEASRQRAAATVASEAVDAGMAGLLDFDHLCSAFRRAFYMKWMSLAVHAREPLRRFDTLTHEGIVNEFRELDEEVLRQNRTGLVGLLRDRVQQNLRQPAASVSLPRLRREMAKQRKLSPLRRTLRECEGAIRAIKPCFMMSPLTVAQYLDGGSPRSTW